MEKLIELLNEYGTQEEIKWKWYFVPNHIQWEGCDNSECSDLLIISKKFWFIKWLVNENKIDYEKVRTWKNSDSEWDFGTCQPEYFVIMLLSVQDDPIDFLISILK